MKKTHGRPDWVRVTTLQDIRDVFGNIPEVSMGELATRMGSISSFERRGEIVYMNDFEDSTLKWVTGGMGTPRSVERSIGGARNSNYSVKMITGPGVEDYVYMLHYLPLPTNTRLGFEFSFAPSSNMDRLYADLVIFDGSKQSYGEFEYLGHLNDLKVQIGPDSYVTLETNINLRQYDRLFSTVKLVVDYKTKKYVRLFLNNKEYDLSDYDMVIEDSIASPHLYFSIALENLNVGSCFVYIDDVIFTQNEP